MSLFFKCHLPTGTHSDNMLFGRVNGYRERDIIDDLGITGYSLFTFPESHVHDLSCLTRYRLPHILFRYPVFKWFEQGNTEPVMSSPLRKFTSRMQHMISLRVTPHPRRFRSTTSTIPGGMATL